MLKPSRAGAPKLRHCPRCVSANEVVLYVHLDKESVALHATSENVVGGEGDGGDGDGDGDGDGGGALP